MPRKIPKTSKKIVIISILFAAILTGLVFACQKNSVSIEDIKNINLSLGDFNVYLNKGDTMSCRPTGCVTKSNLSESGGLDSIGSYIKNMDNTSRFVMIDSSRTSNDNNSDKNNNSEFSKSVEIIAKIGRDFLGLERKDILCFIGKKLEYKPKIIKVPQDYKSIQSAIDNANASDTIEVLPGEYKENIVMKEGVSVIGISALSYSDDGQVQDKNSFKIEDTLNLNPRPNLILDGERVSCSTFFVNKTTTLTTIDGRNSGNVVTFKNGITDKTVLSGFTIKNSGENLSGILIENSSPLIENNIITENEYNIYIKGDSYPTIQKNVITFANKGIQIYNFEKREEKGSGQKIGVNSEEFNSKALELNSFFSSTAPIINDNLITDNKTGIDLYQSAALIDHNTISYNNHYKTYIGPTYGIHLGKSLAEISNNIISDSGICDLCSGIIADEESKGVVISHNDIWNNKNDFVCFGECILENNNISEDPLFVDSINGDFRLSDESALIGRGRDGKDIGIR